MNKEKKKVLKMRREFAANMSKINPQDWFLTEKEKQSEVKREVKIKYTYWE